MLFAAYAVISAVTCLLIMHGAGLSWLPIIGILGPLTLISVAFPAWKAKRARIQPFEA